VSGDELPSTEVALEDMVIGLQPGRELPEILGTQPMDISDVHSYYSIVEAQLRVGSPSFMRANVLATSAFDAIDKAQAHHVPLLQACLSLRHSGLPYRIQLLAAENDRDTQMAGGRGQFASFQDCPMGSEGIRRLQTNHEVLKENAKARRAALLLARGISLSDMGTDLALMSASLLAFHQVLEAVGSAIPSEPPSDIDARRAEIVEKLRADLDPSKTLTKRISSVRRTEADLGRLDAKYISLKIANSGAALGMDAAWQSAATALGKLRNTKLGHSGEAVSMGELAPWLTGHPQGVYGYSAELLAKTLLDAWISKLAPSY